MKPLVQQFCFLIVDIILSTEKLFLGGVPTVLDQLLRRNLKHRRQKQRYQIASERELLRCPMLLQAKQQKNLD